MANRRILVKRRKATRNIRKITRTMQLVATARFQAAHGRAAKGRPYADTLAELVADLSRAAGGVEHPLMREPAADEPVVLVVVTSNRGFCGSYNANVLRLAIEHAEGLPVRPEIEMFGKKGINYMRYVGRDVASESTEIGDTPRFEQIEPVAARLIERFSRREIGGARVVFTRFESAARQRAEVMTLLPLRQAEPDTEATAAPTVGATYEFSPSPEALLDDLLPASVRLRLFRCFSDAAISEQVARMVAMKAATDAAEDRIKQLTREYNRARQTHITMELLDIIGGANAIA